MIREVEKGTLKISANLITGKVNIEKIQKFVSNYCKKNELLEINIIISKTIRKIPNSMLNGYDLENCKLKSLIIENGVEEIGAYSFANNNLASVKIPKSVKKIGRRAFDYNKLSNLKIENGVEEIGDSSFANNVLTSVKIPESVKIIDDYSFCNNNLTSVEILGKLKVINEYSFYDNKLIDVKLGKGVECVGYNVFLANNIKSLSFYSTLKRIINTRKEYYYNDVEDNSCVYKEYDNFKDVEEVTIIEADYEYLKYFEKKLLESFPNLKIIKLISFKNDTDLKNIKLSNPNIQIINQDLGLDNVREEIKIPDEALDLINQIKKIIENLSDDKKIEITAVLDEKVNIYKNEISNKKPQFDLNNVSNYNVSLEITNDTIEQIQFELINSLETLIYNLRFQNQSLEYIKKIKNYQNVLNGLKDPDNEIENEIKKILEISKKLNIDTTFNHLNELILKTEKEIEKCIDFKSPIKLVYKDQINELENDIEKIFEKYRLLENRVNLYIEIKEKIKNNDFACLKEIYIIINELDDLSKKKYEKVLNDLKNEFIIKINNYIELINNEKYLEKFEIESNDEKKCKELEIDFRNKLNPILIELKVDALNYDINGNILNELINSINLLDGNLEKISKGTIYDTVNEIIELSKSLDKNKRNQIIVKIKNIVSKWLEVIKKNDYADLIKKYKDDRPNLEISDSNLIIQLIILNDLIEIKEYINSYIEDKNKYDSLIRKN